MSKDPNGSWPRGLRDIYISIQMFSCGCTALARAFRAFELWSFGPTWRLLLAAQAPHIAQNRCSSLPQGHFALKITAQACFKSHLALEKAARAVLLSHLALEKAARAVLLSHLALEITAQACFKATLRSKSLFKPASKPLCVQNHSSKSLFKEAVLCDTALCYTSLCSTSLCAWICTGSH